MTPLLAALVTIAADPTSAGAIVAPRTGIVKKKSATSASSRSAAQAAGAGQSAGRSDRAARARVSATTPVNAAIFRCAKGSPDLEDELAPKMARLA